MDEEGVIELFEDIFFHHDASLLFFLFDVFFFHGLEGVEFMVVFFPDEHDFGVGAFANNGEHMKLVEPGLGLVFHE